MKVKKTVILNLEKLDYDHIQDVLTLENLDFSIDSMNVYRGHCTFN